MRRGAGDGCRGATGVSLGWKGRWNAGILGFGWVGGSGTFASPLCLARVASLFFFAFLHLFELALSRLGPDMTRRIEGIHGGIFGPDFIQGFV
jgi:hypothetical protein